MFKLNFYTESSTNFEPNLTLPNATVGLNVVEQASRLKAEDYTTKAAHAHPCLWKTIQTKRPFETILG